MQAQPLAGDASEEAGVVGDIATISLGNTPPTSPSIASAASAASEDDWTMVEVGFLLLPSANSSELHKDAKSPAMQLLVVCCSARFKVVPALLTFLSALQEKEDRSAEARRRLSGLTVL